MKTQAGRAVSRSSALLFAVLCTAGTIGAAQTEKIQLRLVPQPDQWVQFHMVQEVATGAITAGDRVLPAMLMKMVATFTQTTGHPDPDGRVKAEVTYDAQGKLVDIQAPSGMPANVVARLREMMTSVFSGLGSSSFAIGETVSTPINMTLPSPADAGPAMTGTVAMILRSISEEGGERLAHFDQNMQLSMESTRKLPAAGSGTDAPTMTMRMKMIGTGTMDYNVNRGFMVANRMQSTTDTKTSFDHPLPKGMPNFDMHMIMKMSIDATY
ncbi:MAG TPA: hypothetical protein VGJ29_20250 [Vicinamibacterales bacterium]